MNQHQSISDSNIAREKVIRTPRELKKMLPLPPRSEVKILAARAAFESILAGDDKRVAVVVGPCSIHDPEQAMEYAHRLSLLAAKVSDTLLLVMRTYFEKPRTSVGWKGFINDPALDGTFDIERGLHDARQLLLSVAHLGLPIGTEALDPVVPQYLDDLVAWTAIGARTTESQTHRDMASGLSTPVGFKNGTDGSIDVAINALKAAAREQFFLGINQDGRGTLLQTRGNKHAHVVLRGGSAGPNYDRTSVAQCEMSLSKAGFPPRIMVDCSHANSQKDFRRQPGVLHNCADQIVAGNRSIIGVMLESHLVEGSQDIAGGAANLKFGISVTDACIDWQTTETELINFAAAVGRAVKQRTLLPSTLA